MLSHIHTYVTVDGLAMIGLCERYPLGAIKFDFHLVSVLHVPFQPLNKFTFGRGTQFGQDKESCFLKRTCTKKVALSWTCCKDESHELFQKERVCMRVCVCVCLHVCV